MQGEEQDQHAGGGVAPMMSGPVVVDVFKEGWVEHLDLVVDRDIQGGDISFIFVFRFIISFWVTTTIDFDALRLKDRISFSL